MPPFEDAVKSTVCPDWGVSVFTDMVAVKPLFPAVIVTPLKAVAVAPTESVVSRMTM